MTDAAPAVGGRRLIATMTGASLVQTGAAAAAALWATFVLGTASRGVMVIAITTAATVALLGGLGTGAAYRALLPTASDAERERLAGAYAAISFLGALLCAGLTVGIMILCAHTIDERLGAAHLQIVVCVSAFAQCLSAQTQEAWFAEGEFNRGSAFAAVATGLGFVGLVVAGLFSKTPTAMILGDLVCEVGVTAIAVAQLRRRRLLLFGGVSWPDVRNLVRRGWPTIGVGVGIILVFRADRYALGAFAGPAAVTVYSLAATLAEATRTVPHQLGQVFIRQVAQGGPGVSLARTIRQAMVALLVSAVIVGGVGWFAIPLVFSDDLRDARDYLLLLLGAEVLFCPFFVAARGLVGGGWTRITGVIGGIGCAAAVGSYVALVPHLGIVGACLASAVTYLGLSIATVMALSTRLQNRAPGPPFGEAVGDDSILDGPVIA